MIRVTPADRYFSLCVRERAAWTCERCGKQYVPPTQALHCAHWHSRGNWSVRFDPYNALALCYGCHILTSRDRESEHLPLMRKSVGEIQLDRLAYDKNRPANGIKRRIKDIAHHYRETYEAMIRQRMNGKQGRLEFDAWQ